MYIMYYFEKSFKSIKSNNRLLQLRSRVRVIPPDPLLHNLSRVKQTKQTNLKVPEEYLCTVVTRCQEDQKYLGSKLQIVSVCPLLFPRLGSSASEIL